MNINIKEYITESNAIEGVFSEDAIDASLVAWEWLEERPLKLTLKDILTLHAEIMSPFNVSHAGHLRRVNVQVGGEVKLKWQLVEDHLIQLLSFVPYSGFSALDWHIQFEEIHPFQDGNGRSGRMLYWHQCLKLGIEPILFKKSEIHQYYGLFRKVK